MMNQLLLKNIFFWKLKLKKEYDRKSLNLLTFINNKIIDNHTSRIAYHEDYETKINNVIYKLKESWKNEYKNNNM